MSKQKPAGLMYSAATPKQVADAKQIIEDAAKHRYYVSRIYTMFNAITGKNEPPQTCSSCLRSRAKEIKKWYDEGVKSVDANKAKAPITGNPEITEEEAKAAEEELNAKAAELNAKAAEEAKAADTFVAGVDVGKGEDKAAQVTVTVTDGKVTVLDEQPTAEIDPNGLPAPSKGVTRIPMEQKGVFVDFTPNDGAEFVDGVKGVATYVDGKKVNAGTYKTAQGHTLKIQVGGKGTYLENHDDLAS